MNSSLANSVMLDATNDSSVFFTSHPVDRVRSLLPSDPLLESKGVSVMSSAPSQDSCLSGVVRNIAKGVIVATPILGTAYFVGTTTFVIAVVITAGVVVTVALATFLVISCYSRFRRYPQYNEVKEYREVENGFRLKSHVYSVGGDPLVNKIGIAFINGMGKQYEDAKKNAEYLSGLAGGARVGCVYNATPIRPKSYWWSRLHALLKNVGICDMGLRGIATEPVKELHKLWDQYFDRAPSDAKLLVVCHSQGTIHVANALMKMSKEAQEKGMKEYPELRRKRIYVLAVAGAKYIDDNRCAGVAHLIVKNRKLGLGGDPVPRIDGHGLRKHKKTVKEVDSVRGEKRIDHRFQSATYKKWVAGYVKNFIDSDGKKFASDAPVSAEVAASAAVRVTPARSAAICGCFLSCVRRAHALPVVAAVA